MRRTARDTDVKAAFDKFHASIEPKATADTTLRKDLSDADPKLRPEFATKSKKGKR